MQLINLITGHKRNLIANLNSILNCQNKDIRNINFFIFWDNDYLNDKEILLIKKKIKNTHFVKVNQNKYKKKVNKILKNKNYPKNLKNHLVGLYLQYSILNFSFNYACKFLKKNLNNFYWQRVRTDTYIEKKIPILKKKNVLLLPGTIHGYGILDYHCLGSFSVFKIYANLIKTIEELFILNIFIPAEIILRIHLSKNKVNSIITEKLPAALLKNSKNLKLRTMYSRNRGNKFLTNQYSSNIIEKDFKFKNNIFLRKIYYFSYDIFVRIKLVIFNK
tara:strand:+ start:30 stop:857 length:828 start_codon:yes stop_codon:yes gene_type:complete